MGHLLSKGFPGVGHLTVGVIFVFQVMEWDYFANESNAGGGGGLFQMQMTALFLMRLPRISLCYKLVLVQYQEQEYDLL